MAELAVYGRFAQLREYVGDETAASLGIAVERFRIEIFVVSALVTGTMSAFSAVGFVGLMVPMWRACWRRQGLAR